MFRLTDAVVQMITDLPADSTFTVTATVGRRYGLSPARRRALWRRLSVASATERRLIGELRRLLPVGRMNGNTATVAVSRSERWMRRRDQRHRQSVNEGRCRTVATIM